MRGLYTFLHNAEAERDWLYDPAYWQGYADELARCRYNRFNLIYGHQSPHLIPIYAFMLDDLDEAYPEIRVQGITAEERARNLLALQDASAAMAGRGLRFFLGIWNSRPWKIAQRRVGEPAHPRHGLRRPGHAGGLHPRGFHPPDRAAARTSAASSCA